MIKNITYENECQTKLLNGLDKLANAVKTTLGPSGRLVLIQNDGKAPLTTKDGVTVAKSIELKDPVENLGAQLAINVASKTNDDTGDGTTTATVLAQAICHNGFDMIKKGAKPSKIKIGIEKAVNKVCETLDKKAIQIQDFPSIRNVATISANNDSELGIMIADAVNKVGKNGVVRVEESKTGKTSVNIMDGLQFDRGYISPYFVTNPTKPICELNNPLILLYNHKLSIFDDFKDAITYAAENHRPFLVVADDVDGEALTTLIYNHVNNKIKCCAIKAPGFGDTRPGFFNDLAMMVGGKLISEDTGTKLSELDPKTILGSAEKVIITKNNITIMHGNVNPTEHQERIQLLKNGLDLTKNPMEKKHLEDRLAKIDGGIAVISVGGTTEVELRETKDRVDDAVHATMAAIEEGIIPGGGVALLKSAIINSNFDSEDDEDINNGYKLLLDAIKTPLIQINDNNGEQGQDVLDNIVENFQNSNCENFNFGYDAKSNKYQDLILAGIIDPVKVTKAALKNAASIAIMLLSTACVINTSSEDNKLYALPQMSSQMPELPALPVM